MWKFERGYSVMYFHFHFFLPSLSLAHSFFLSFATARFSNVILHINILSKSYAVVYRPLSSNVWHALYLLCARIYYIRLIFSRHTFWLRFHYNHKKYMIENKHTKKQMKSIEHEREQRQHQLYDQRNYKCIATLRLTISGILLNWLLFSQPDSGEISSNMLDTNPIFQSGFQNQDKQSCQQRIK